jgi:hypothetical protein
MSDTVAATPAPKKPMFTLKNLFIAIAFILGLLGLDHYTLNLVSGGSVTVTDSTIVVSAPIVEPLPVTDTVKLDTSNTK